MVLDVDRQMLGAGLERHALRNRPALQHAVALEPEVVVEPTRVVALNDEDRLPTPAGAATDPKRLRRRCRSRLPRYSPSFGVFFTAFPGLFHRLG